MTSKTVSTRATLQGAGSAARREVRPPMQSAPRRGTRPTTAGWDGRPAYTVRGISPGIAPGAHIRRVSSDSAADAATTANGAVGHRALPDGRRRPRLGAAKKAVGGVLARSRPPCGPRNDTRPSRVYPKPSILRNEPKLFLENDVTYVLEELAFRDGDPRNSHWVRPPSGRGIRTQLRGERSQLLR